MATVKIDRSKILSSKGISVAAGKPDVVIVDKTKLLTTKGLSAAIGKPPKDV